MRGDLDAIALKALEKERSRRYGSPSDFAADIGRYLKNETVLAVPPSVAYRAGKFARRYRGGIDHGLRFRAGADRWHRPSASAEHRAQSIATARTEKRQSAQAVNDFLQNDLLAQASAANQSGPSVKPDPDLKVRTALDRAAAAHRWKVRPATGGGGVRFGTPSGRRTWTSGCTRKHGCN